MPVHAGPFWLAVSESLLLLLLLLVGHNITMQGDGAVVQAPLSVAGRSWAMTCVSMGNPHAVTYSVDGQPIKVQ